MGAAQERYVTQEKQLQGWSDLGLSAADMKLQDLVFVMLGVTYGSLTVLCLQLFKI